MSCGVSLYNQVMFHAAVCSVLDHI